MEVTRLVEITFYGHSCFEIEIKKSKTKMIIDPFITGNPLANVSYTEINVDYILVTHAHNDHIGDTIEIAKRTNATVISNYEIASWLGFKGIKNHPLAIGGSALFPFGRVKLTPALHGSTLINEETQELITLGTAGGFILMLEEETLYHAGDTGLFLDMKLIGEQHEIDVAFLPVGDNFTMGPSDALLAAEWVKAKKVVPMHYDTFPVIEQNVSTFIKDLGKRQIQGIILEPGQRILLD